MRINKTRISLDIQSYTLFCWEILIYLMTRIFDSRGEHKRKCDYNIAAARPSRVKEGPVHRSGLARVDGRFGRSEPLNTLDDEAGSLGSG